MSCEICGSDKYKIIATKMRDGDGEIVQCLNCGLVFQNTKYNDSEISDYYNNDYFQTNSLDSEKKQTAEEHFNSRLATIEPIKKDIVKVISENFSYKPNILELGASTGELLHVLSSFANILTGIELNEEFCTFGNDKLEKNITMIPKDINNIEFNEKYDLIISNYTLDHLVNPIETLRKLKTVMEQRGVMYLLVPNRDEALNYYASPDTEGCYQSFFWHKAHMFYFTKDTFEKALSKVGLKAEFSCMHEYSFKNFLQWYFTGKPGREFEAEINNRGLFADSDTSGFAIEVNKLMCDMDDRFKDIIESNWGGDTIRAIAKNANVD